MAGLGLRETISFPFLDDEDQTRLRLPEGHPLTPSLSLKNPLVERTGKMQTTLVPALAAPQQVNGYRHHHHHRFDEPTETWTRHQSQMLPPVAAGQTVPAQFERAQSAMAPRPAGKAASTQPIGGARAKPKKRWM